MTRRYFAQRSISVLLCLILCLSLFPAFAHAEEISEEDAWALSEEIEADDGEEWEGDEEENADPGDVDEEPEPLDEQEPEPASESEIILEPETMPEPEVTTQEPEVTNDPEQTHTDLTAIQDRLTARGYETRQIFRNTEVHTDVSIDGAHSVKLDIPQGAFDRDVVFFAATQSWDDLDEAYIRKLAEEQNITRDDNPLLFDIGFMDESFTEIEPNVPVGVKITTDAQQLVTNANITRDLGLEPQNGILMEVNDADVSADVLHINESRGTGTAAVVDTVASTEPERVTADGSAEVSVEDGVVTASFETDSFSTIAINSGNYSSYLTLTDGNTYYLSSNVTLSETMTISGTVNLYLNGYTLRCSDATKSVITVLSGSSSTSTLNLYDYYNHSGTGTITGMHGTDRSTYGAISVGGSSISSGLTYTGILNMYGGQISGNISEQTAGAGIYVWPYGYLNLYGGTITNNSSYMYGGGIYSCGKTVNIYGGTISNNTVTGTYASGCGVYVTSCDAFQMTGGTITGNTASAANTSGGGLYLTLPTPKSGNYAQATITGGTISGNTGKSQVYVSDFYSKSGRKYYELTIGGNAAITCDTGASLYLYGGSSAYSFSRLKLSYDAKPGKKAVLRFSSADGTDVTDKYANFASATNGYYYLNWEDVTTRTITFKNASGNSTLGTQYVVSGEETALTKQYEPDGFPGWATEANGETVYASGAKVTLTNDLVLYVSTPKITVNFYNGATKLGSQTLPKGVAQNLSTEYQGSVSSYSFYGWATSSGTATRAYTSGQSVTLSGNTTLYAIYSRSVTFLSGTDRSATNSVTQYYYGGSAKPITTPSATSPAGGWTLLGWTTGTTYDSGNAVNTASTVSFTPGATTYYARWSRTVTVNYNGNGASGSTTASTATQYYNSYGAISTPSVTLATNGFTAPTGMAFQQWGESASATTGNDAGSAYTGFSPTVGDTTLSTTLYAIWQSTTGTASITAQTYNSAKIALSTSSTSNTSSYAGTASSGTCTISNVNAGTYYVWASAADDNSTLYLYTGKTVTVPSGGTGSATVTYYKVTPSASNATVKVDMYAGNSSSTTKIYTRSNSSYTYLLSGCYAYVTSGTVTGYSSVSLTKNSSAISSGTWHQITAATTFAATGTPNTITVNFYKNTTKLGSQTYTYNTAQNLSTSYQGSVSGYSFAGWAASNSTDAITYTGGQSVTNPNGATSGSVSLYAVYSRTINFYSGAAQGTTNYVTQYYYGGSAKAVTAPGITAPNNSWTAYGWWTGTSASYSRTVAASTSFTPSATAYYATFSRTVTVNYGGNGASGSTTASTTTQYYNSYGNISSPSVTLASSGFTTPSGFSFYRWGTSTTATSGTAANGSYTYAPTVGTTSPATTLHAIWTRSITFTSGTGTSNTVTQYYRSGAFSVTTPTATNPSGSNGWGLLGWTTGTAYNSSNAVSTTSTTSFTPDSTTYYARWSRTVTVNYGGNGASGSTGASTATQYYNSYGNISSPSVTLASSGFTAPTGYSFYRWGTSTTATSGTAAEASYSFSPAVGSSNSTTVYAIWTRPITFYSGVDKSTTDTVTQYYRSGAAAITSPSITAPVSWTAYGWWSGTAASHSRDVAANTSFTPGSTAYYATFSRTLTVNYNGNGGSGSTAASTATQYYNSYGNISSPSITLASNGFTAPTGRYFYQWGASASSSSGTSAGASYTALNPGVSNTTTSKTLYAIWKNSSYTVSYQKDGGTIANESGYTSYTYGTGLKLPTPEREGYRFEGWYADSTLTGSPITAISETETGNKTFYAKWTLARVFSVTVPAALPVTLNADGQVTVATDAAIVNNGTDTVQVTNVAINAADGWTLDSSTTQAALPVDSRKFALTVKTGTGAEVKNQTIAAGDSLSLRYNAAIAAQSEAVEARIANVVFTVAWEAA